MAAFDVKSTLDWIENYVKRTNYFQQVQVGEYKQPPSATMAVGIWMSSTAVARLFADGGTDELHVLTMRVYRNMLQEPAGLIEKEMAKAVSRLLSDMLADADLNGTVMTIDAGGINGTVLRSDWGYVDVSGTMFRSVDIALPLIVHDSATVTA